MRSDSTQRFSNRVDDYVRGRPGYPSALADALHVTAGLMSHSVVADIGSGTGISTDLFLSLGCTVYAVEPNDAMRASAESRLAHAPAFHSVNGTAEATTLPAGSVDLVAAGQAFHWFDVTSTRREFARILRPGGCVALFWNVRRVSGSHFLESYEALLRQHGTDYLQVRHQADPERAARFLGDRIRRQTFANEQVLDYDALVRRLLSSSYVPPLSDPRHVPMLDALRHLFDTYQQGGRVRMVYDTELYTGPAPVRGAHT